MTRLVETAVAENCWEIEPGLFRILLPLPWNVPFVHAYLLSAEGTHVLIDCGLNWTPGLRALGRALKAAGVPAGGLEGLILTHRHFDHAGAARPVQDRWGGRAWMHPVDIAASPTAPEAFSAWMQAHGCAPDEAAGYTDGSRRRRPLESLPDRMEPLLPGQPIACGPFRLTVVEAFGHSPGHVMVVEESRGWVFSGDHVLPHPALNVWGGPADERAAEETGRADPLTVYLDALDRLAFLPARLVLPGHGLPWYGDLRAASSATADLHRRFARRLGGALDGQPLTARELLGRDRLGARLEPDALRAALGETVAALWHLRRLGEVREIEDGGLIRWEWGRSNPGKR